MRNLIVGFTLFCIVLSPAFIFCNAKEEAELENIANELMTAVIKEDIKMLLKYVPPGGTYFIDDHYTFEKIRKLLENKESWLCKHLFLGENSVKNYFENAKGLTIRIDYYDKDKAVSIFYQSSNYAPLTNQSKIV